MEQTKRVIYYNDELGNDFAGSNVKPKVIDANYKYISKNPIYKFFSFIAYRIIATPIAICYKLFRGVKFENNRKTSNY